MIKDSNYSISQIGTGKYTKVYCMEIDSNKNVAVKILKPAFEKSKLYQDQIIRKAKLGMQIKHPQIRKVYDIVHNEDDNTYQIMMEYLEGYDMQEYINNFGNIPGAQVEEWLKKILPALIETHEKGIIHGHIKPANLFITPRGELKLCDFEGALYENELYPEAVDTYDIMYLSPEQISINKPITETSDIYSLGVTMYTLLTGKDPYALRDEDVDTLRFKILNETLPFIEHVSLKLNSLIQSCTAKNPEDRYQHVADMLNEIDGGAYKKKKDAAKEVQADLFSTAKENTQTTSKDVDVNTSSTSSSAKETKEFVSKISDEPVVNPIDNTRVDQKSDPQTTRNVILDEPIASNKNSVEETDSEEDDDPNKPSLEERVQAIWDKIGVGTETDKEVKVSTVTTVRNIESTIDNNSSPTSSSSLQDDVKKSSVTKEIEVKEKQKTVAPETKVIPNIPQTKSQPVDDKKLSTQGDDTKKNQTTVVPPTIKSTPVEKKKEKSPSDFSQKKEKTTLSKETKTETSLNKNTSAKSSSTVNEQVLEENPTHKTKWGLVVLGLLALGTILYFSYPYFKNAEQEEGFVFKSVPSEPTINTDEKIEDSIPSVPASVEAAVMDTIMSQDEIVQSLEELESAKIQKIKENDRKRQELIRLEKEKSKIDVAKIELVGPYVGQLAPFKHNGLIGFIDRNNTVVKKPIYTEILTFHGGLTAVKNSQGKWGFVNADGNEVIKTQYEEIFGFSKGMAGAKKNGKWGFIGTKGQVIVPFLYEVVTDYNDGLAGVRRAGKWGFVSTKGKEVIACEYDNAWSFKDGLAGVEKDGKWGFINKNGAAQIPLKYSQVNNFSEGMACVEYNGKYGFIDKSGTEVIDFKYDAAKPFNNGTARVFSSGKWIYINKSGKCVRDCN